MLTSTILEMRGRMSALVWQTHRRCRCVQRLQKPVGRSSSPTCCGTVLYMCDGLATLMALISNEQKQRENPVPKTLYGSYLTHFWGSGIIWVMSAEKWISFKNQNFMSCISRYKMSCLFCYQLCVVGIHRSIAASKIRSLRMDSKVWKPSIIQVRDHDSEGVRRMWNEVGWHMW